MGLPHTVKLCMTKRTSECRKNKQGASLIYFYDRTSENCMGLSHTVSFKFFTNAERGLSKKVYFLR
mgnify:CR=1